MNTEIAQRVGLIFADLAAVTLLELNGNDEDALVTLEEAATNNDNSRNYTIENLATAGNA